MRPGLRLRAYRALRVRPWLPGIACALFGLAAAASPLRLVVTGLACAAAFVWGYTRRAFRPEPHRRGQYGQVWDGLATDTAAAHRVIAGGDDAVYFERTGRDTALQVAELVGIQQEHDVLEIGCGAGRVGLYVRERCASWIGADVSRKMLALAAERLPAGTRLIHLPESNLSPITDSCVDVAYATTIFMHLDEWDRWRYVTEAFRVLRPGGRLYIDNIDLESAAGFALFRALSDAYPPAARPPYISHASTGAELATYVQQAGFFAVETHHRSPLVVVTGTKPAGTAILPQARYN